MGTRKRAVWIKCNYVFEYLFWMWFNCGGHKHIFVWIGAWHRLQSDIKAATTTYKFDESKKTTFCRKESDCNFYLRLDVHLASMFLHFISMLCEFIHSDLSESLFMYFVFFSCLFEAKNLICRSRRGQLRPIDT